MTSPPWDIQWTKQSGRICEEYTIEYECLKGEVFKEFFKLELIFDGPEYIFISIINSVLIGRNYVFH